MRKFFYMIFPPQQSNMESRQNDADSNKLWCRRFDSGPSSVMPKTVAQSLAERKNRIVCRKRRLQQFSLLPAQTPVLPDAPCYK